MVLWIHVVVAVKVEPLAACAENTVGPDEALIQGGVVVQVQDTAARDLEGVLVKPPLRTHCRKCPSRCRAGHLVLCHG